MKKFLVGLFSCLIVMAALVGCGGGDDNGGGEDAKKAAIVFTGPANDGGWAQSGLDGLKMVEEDLGWEIAYNENTKPSDFEKIIKDYAKDGYSVIIGHSFEFLDAVKVVAPEYPDSVFLITSTDHTAKIADGNNIGSVLGNGVEQGFIQGITAAYCTESNSVAGIGGLDIPAMKFGVEGFKAGSKFGAEDLNKTVDVKTALTGSNDDLQKMKEQASTMIEQGADVVMSTANNAGKGAYDAAKEKGVYAIGSIGGTNDFSNYPETLIASGKVDMAQSILNVVKLVDDGTFEAKDYVNGIAEGVVSLAFNESLVPTKWPDLEKYVEGVMDKIKSGDIDVESYMD